MRELLAIVALIALFLFDPRTVLERARSQPAVAPAADAEAPIRRAAPVHNRARFAARGATRA